MPGVLADVSPTRRGASVNGNAMPMQLQLDADMMDASQLAALLRSVLRGLRAGR